MTQERWDSIQEFLKPKKQVPNGKQQPVSSEKTIGQLITEAINLHELNPDVIAKELQLRGNTIYDLMNDSVYTNCIPIVLFKNLVLSLHIPFKDIEAAMIPTFKLLVSKEIPETIKKKSAWAPLWENEESILKYTNRLRQLMNAPNESISAEEIFEMQERITGLKLVTRLLVTKMVVCINRVKKVYCFIIL